MEYKRPKRRKSKDNPYTLEYCENEHTYKINFKDGEGVFHSIVVNEAIFNEFDKFELKDKSQMNEFDNHIEHSEMTEITLNKLAICKDISIEEKMIIKSRNEELHKAIELLPEVQKRRIKMYFFEEMKQREIAQKEGVSLRKTQDSISKGIKKLKKILKTGS